ncbi:MAG: hypothetical protein KTR13_05310 [Saprospiraceae bacterium]|nr:hypothetical protein [Saprospiraceae bacterium]
MDNFNIAIIVFVVFYFVSRIIAGRAIQLLNDDQKVDLMQYYTKNRWMSFLPTLILIGGYFLLIRQFPDYILLWLVLIIVFFIGMMIYRYQELKKKMADKNFPDQYYKQMLLSTGMNIFGFLGFIIIAVLIN